MPVVIREPHFGSAGTFSEEDVRAFANDVSQNITTGSNMRAQAAYPHALGGGTHAPLAPYTERRFAVNLTINVQVNGCKIEESIAPDPASH